MVVVSSVTLNRTFAHLNDDRSLAVKANAASREREAVIDVVFGSSVTYVTDGLTVDFSKVRRFKTVYVCEIAHKTLGRNVTYVPGTGNDSATGKLKVFDDGGSELANDSTETEGQSFRVIIRGI